MKRLKAFLLGFSLLIILSAAPLWSQQFPELGKLVNSGQLDQARSALQAELQTAPENPELLYWKAVLEMKEGRTAQAEKTLQAVVEKGIAQPPHFLMLADIYNARQQWAESVQVYRQALVKQYTPRMAYNLALAEFQLKNFDAVIEAVQPLAENPDANWRFHHLLGLAYFGRNDFGEALPHLGKAADAEPVQADNIYDYALALLQARRFEEAVKHFKRTIELQPSWARAHL
ncbi:MAG: tetratricopeptide repeat protein, partial [Acidobacteriota bacterium]